MGRGRACWRSPPADKYFHCTCRTSPTLSGLQGSGVHLRKGAQQMGQRLPAASIGLLGAAAEVSRGVRLYLCIWGNTAGARPLGFHTAGQDTWLCYISHGLSEREFTSTFRPRSLRCDIPLAAGGWGDGMCVRVRGVTSVQTQRMQNMSPKGSR